MKKVLNVFKPISATPLQVIRAYQEKYPEYKEETLGYAGRLDPMAEGVLLILVGEENKKRKSYEKLPKQYEFTVTFGIATDSYDLMGKITQVTSNLPSTFSLPDTILEAYKGLHEQEYPPYSSPKVDGKQLFKWAREGKIHEIEIPRKQIEIFELQLTKKEILSGEMIANDAIEKISRVSGVFRQEEIIENWKDFKTQYSSAQFPVFTFSISCSSGTYVRSIAYEMGKKLGMGAIASSIKRTAVGEFEIKDSEVIL